MAIDDGGSAYPTVKSGHPVVPLGELPKIPKFVDASPGMTYLDAAAIAALPVVGPYLCTYAPDKAAKVAYELAEAMLIEKRRRERGEV